MIQRLKACAALMMICFLTSGCGEITLGPRVETKTVIVHEGRPLQLLENETLKARDFDNTTVDQDVGGWVCMPPDHWNAIARKIGAKLVPETSDGSGTIALPAPAEQLPGK